jgi:hypothetical protein
MVLEHLDIQRQKKKKPSQALGAHACNASYSEGRHQEN